MAERPREPRVLEELEMKIRNWMTAAFVALVSAAFVGTALADNGNGLGPNGWSKNRGGFHDRGPRSMTLEGTWVSNGRDANVGSGRGPMRDLLLPGVIQIDQRPNRVVISDRGNQTLQVIQLGGKFAARGDRPDYVAGHFEGGTLVVGHAAPRGTITQSFQLSDRGRTLIVTTRHEGGRRNMEMTTTYHRA